MHASSCDLHRGFTSVSTYDGSQQIQTEAFVSQLANGVRQSIIP